MKPRKTCWARLGAWIVSLLLGVSLAFSNLSPQVHAQQATGSVQQQFIQSIAGSAVQIARAHGLFPSVMIAQAILESDWGRSGLARPPYYNLFGIKGGSDGVVFDTLEDDGTGRYYGIKDSFRRYNSYLESLQDYAELFRSTPYLTRVYAGFVNAQTIEEATQALTGTYATDTRYGSKLMNIIIGYNLTQYDGAVNRAPSWAITPKDDVVYAQYGEVNIREDHSTDSAVLGRAKYGQRFRRLGVTTGWTLVQLEDGRKAYMASEYLDTQVPPEEADQPETPQPNPTGVAGQPGLPDPAAPKPSAVAPAEPAPPAEPTTEPEGPSEEEIEAARKAADQAIAEGPTAAAKDGLLDTRTAGVKTENPVNKAELEGFLGSNVDLPFTSEAVKQEYRETLQRAVNLYWSAKVTQEEIDEVVERLTQLREQAEEEDAEGLKQDQEQLREVQDSSGVTLNYTKQQVDATPMLEVTVKNQPKLDAQTFQKLRSRGQKMFTYRVELYTESGETMTPKKPLQLQLPLPKGFDQQHTEVYVLEPQGQLKALPARWRGSMLMVQGKTFGDFIFVERHTPLLQALQARTVYAEAQPGQAFTVQQQKTSVYWIPLIALFLLGLTLGLRSLYQLAEVRKNLR